MGAARTGRSRVLRTLAVLAVCLVLGALVAGAAWIRPAFTPPIAGANSIAELEPVTLGGARQWILIRGADKTKPVVLFLHGGPGAALVGLSHRFQTGLEQDFVVVQWDRRGEGKSFGEALDPASLKSSQELADAVELIGVLRHKLGAERVILIGQDDGATLGAALAQAHPELVRALVAVGMTSCTPEDVHAIQDSWLRSRAALVGDDRTAALAGGGGAWDRGRALYRYGGVLAGHSTAWTLGVALATAPEYRLAEALNLGKGMALTRARLQLDGPAQPLIRSIPAIHAPVFFMLGRHDYVSPTICTERYADLVQAPLSREIWFEHSAHYPFLEEPRAFRRALDDVAIATTAPWG